MNNGVHAIPDFRNLGVCLRILVGVNLVLVLGSLLASRELDEWLWHLLDAALLVEPGLLGWLGLMMLVAPWLLRLPVALAYGVIVCSALVCAVVLRLLFTPILGEVHVFGWWRLCGLTLALVLAGLAYFDARYRALRPALTEARLQALQARIRPHFLFNSLNAAINLIRHQPQQAERALEDMADLFRVFMRENRELTTLAKEVALTRQYLALEGLRLGDRLSVQWNTQNMPERALLPPLILQPLLENAVVHGIEPMRQPGIIRVDIYRKENWLHLVVKNPCTSAGSVAEKGGNNMACANIRERLELFYDAEAQMRIQSSSNAYRVHIVLPFRELSGRVTA
jgi:two-component system, LytTR family, sensor histidine kinase AlgZ